MAKKLVDNPAGGPSQEPQPAVDPVAAQMAAARKGRANPQPIYYQRGIAGRDGTGEYIAKYPVMMPNGDYAKPGDTFNQRDEGLNDAQMRELLSKYVEANRDKSVRPEMVRKPLVPDLVTKEAAGGGGKADPASC